MPTEKNVTSQHRLNAVSTHACALLFERVRKEEKRFETAIYAYKKIIFLLIDRLKKRFEGTSDLKFTG